MTWHGRRVTVYAYRRPTDMRKGFDGLSALVTQDLSRDPLSGEVFIFVSRDRVRTKVLQWDGTGLCVYAKRLEHGRFACLWREAGDPPIALTSATSTRCARSASSSIARINASSPRICS
jgi:transposase